MFEKLLSFVGVDAHPNKETALADADHAFGALLVRMAKIDNRLDVSEIQKIDQILAKRFGLNVVDAARFRADCERLDDALPDTTDLTDLLVQDVSLADREQMFRAMWDVLLADGRQLEAETDMLGQVAQLFGIDGTRAVELAAA